MDEKSTPAKTVTQPDGTADPVVEPTTVKGKAVAPEKPAGLIPATDPAVESDGADAPDQDPEADRNAADADEAQAQEQAPTDAGPTVVTTKENTYTYPQGQGNTNPKDFEVFGEGGEYVEKRDR